MRHLAKASVALILLAALVAPPPRVTAAETEYLTEAEIDLIRDAQEISQRVPIYLKLAEKRLVFLGLIEKSEQEKQKDLKAKEKAEKDAKRTPKAGESKANAKNTALEDMTYLSDFSRSELLRGYAQVLEEIMSNIDEAYNRRLEVRDPLEDLEKFTRETAVALGKFQPKNKSEELALSEAVDKAKEANNGAKEAMSIVPKTEKKRKP
jgi:hypothetical protein